jgi:ATP-dependent RNA helicase RhlE
VQNPASSIARDTVPRFSSLGLSEPLLRAIEREGYDQPTPIQERAIPIVLEGSDVLGCAQTGTGKTAAFALPILQRLGDLPPYKGRGPRCLVLSPTRELASQIGDSFEAYGRHTGFTHAVVFGGVNQSPQARALRHGVDVLIATPGRLLDLMGQGLVHLERLEIFVLDEADRMLDMGFIQDVNRIAAALPRDRQTLFFSATLPPDIERLAHSMLSSPVRVEVAPAASTAERIRQSVYFVERACKRALLQHLLRDAELSRALVFTRTKHAANRLANDLVRAGVHADAIHGNKSQEARERALEDFRAGTCRVLVATDIAARGIDVEAVSHVINFDMPNVPESYVHRIGRTARAGADGVAISFCELGDRPHLAAIEKLIRAQVPREDHPFASEFGPPPARPRPPASHGRLHGRPLSRHRGRRR